MKKVMLACAALAACSSTPAPRPATPRPPPEPSQTTGGLEHGMMNCPSAVEGARTELRMTAGGVDLIVTTRDPAARIDLVRLADLHARLDRITEWPEHSGMHGGPGKIGHCPVIHDGTRISLSPYEDGVVMHVIALSPDRVRSVQAQTEQRLASMPKYLPRSAQR